MGKGQAEGENRAYQLMCKEVLISYYQSHRLVVSPYYEDGIDIPFSVANTDVSIDIALTDSSGNLILAECKRWAVAVPQDQVFSFAHRVELMRREYKVNVAAFMFSTNGFQSGALKTGGAKVHQDIGLVLCGQDQIPPNIHLTFLRWDATRLTRIQDHIHHLTASIKISSSVSARVIRADGTIEEDAI